MRKRWLSTILTACSLAVVSGCASSAQSNAPHSTKAPLSTARTAQRIILQFNTGHAGDAYVAISPDGTEERSLEIPGNEPAGFSANLQKVAFANQGSIDSGHPNTLLSVSAPIAARASVIWTVPDDVTAAPTWNPAGTRMALGVMRIQSRSGAYSKGSVPDGLWTIDADGSHRHLVVPGRIGSAAWSPDGSKIAFVMSGYPRAVLDIVASSGGPVTQIGSIPTDQASQPIAWSPDGRQIVLAYIIYAPGSGVGLSSGVSAYPVGGGSPKEILPAQSTDFFTGIAYSPDGSQMAISVVQAGDSSPPNVTVPSASESGGPNKFTVDLMDQLGSGMHQIASYPTRAEVVGWFNTD